MLSCLSYPYIVIKKKKDHGQDIIHKSSEAPMKGKNYPLGFGGTVGYRDLAACVTVSLSA